jgi:transposase
VSNPKDALNLIKQLERALGHKTLENDILKEAMDVARGKMAFARQHCLGATIKGRLRRPPCR